MLAFTIKAFLLWSSKAQKGIFSLEFGVWGSKFSMETLLLPKKTSVYEIPQMTTVS